MTKRQSPSKIVGEIERAERLQVSTAKAAPIAPKEKAPKLSGAVPPKQDSAPHLQSNGALKPGTPPKATSAPSKAATLRAHPTFNMRARAGSIHTPDYQAMTDLPDDLERALIELPMNALLERCGWIDAQTKYSCIKHLALTCGVEALRKFVSEPHQPDERLPKAPETPEHKAIVARAEGKIAPLEGAVPKAPLIASDKLLVTKLKGKTAIQAGSLRAKVLEALSAAGGKATEAVLSKACGFSVRPVLGKLREAGWVKTEEQP